LSVGEVVGRSPNLGRFLSSDRGPYIWGDPQTLNRYTYTRNNPLKYVDPTGKYFVVVGTDAFKKQVQNYISTLSRNDTGKAMVDSVAKSPKPTFVSEQTLPRQENKGGTISVTAGQTTPIAGDKPGGVAGATLALDNSNIAFVAEKKHESTFQVGLTAFGHELSHDVAIMAAPTLQAAAAAGAAGDAPSSPGANNTTGGTAEAIAQEMVAALGEAGKDFAPDEARDSYAAQILMSGADQYENGPSTPVEWEGCQPEPE
jgi:hypothetical protein